MTLPTSVSWKKIATILLVVFGIGNLVLLDIAIFSKIWLPQQLSQERTPSTEATQTESCDKDCVADIHAQLASLSAALAEASPSPASKTTPQAKAVATVKEFYIPLGSGSTINNQWEDVSGAEILLDSASYPNIKEVHFEAGLRVPVANGTVNARLFNVTDQHPVWFSDVSATTSNSTFASSGAITLDPGSKLYRVQIQSTLQYPAYMDMARIKIVVK